MRDGDPHDCARRPIVFGDFLTTTWIIYCYYDESSHGYVMNTVSYTVTAFRDCRLGAVIEPRFAAVPQVAETCVKCPICVLFCACVFEASREADFGTQIRPNRLLRVVGPDL
jgi:hypothetical protein